MAIDLGYDLPQEETLDATVSEKAIKVRTRIQNDYLKADIFFETLNEKSIIETPSTPVRFSLKQ